MTQNERNQRAILAPLLGILVAAGGLWLVSRGLYGLTLFVVIPILMGAIGTLILRPKTLGEVAAAGLYMTVSGLCCLFFLKIEGLGCLVMVVPLALPLGIFGAWIAYVALGSVTDAKSGSSVAMLFLLTAPSLAWDMTARPPVFEVRTAIEVAASPEQVWKHVVTFSKLPEPHEWYFNAGLAYPKRARIEGSGAGAIRYCEFSTGPFVEPIQTWDEPRLLQFRVTKNPAPMHEWTPYAEVLPKHLHGYLVSKKGQFRLTPLPNHHTLLEGTTWYQHGLWPAQYWRLWSDAIIHRIHLRVLNHIRTLAEAEGTGRPAQ
jgi:hypothetical protein